jgi:hypothetical protein
MVLLVAALLSAALWVLLWGLGAKALDALLLALVIMIIAAIAHILAPFLPGRRPASETDPDPAPYT